MSIIKEPLQQTRELCNLVNTQENRHLKDKAANAVDFIKTITQDHVIGKALKELEALETCERQLQQASEGESGIQANVAGSASSSADGTTSLSHARSRTTMCASLPAEIYSSIARQCADFDGLDRDRTLLSLAQVNREWSRAATDELYAIPRRLYSFSRQLLFAFGLYLNPSAARAVSTLELAWVGGKGGCLSSKLLQMILSRCGSLKNLTIERGHVIRRSREPITQADIDALDAMLSPLSQLEEFKIKYFGYSSDEDARYSLSTEDTEDTSIQLHQDPRPKDQLQFPRSLTDRVRSLRSIALDGRPMDWIWPVFMRCIGPGLRSLSTGAFLEAGDVDQFAAACTELERFEQGNTSVTQAEVSKLIISCGNHLKHIKINGLHDEDGFQRLQIPLDAMRPSVVQTLAEHSNSLEVPDLRNEVCVRLADLQALESSESCPALRKLLTQNIEGQGAGVDPRIDAALAAVVEFHTDTLEEIRLACGRFGHDGFEVGNTFIRACASLGPQIREIDAKAAEDLDITLVDVLYRKHPRLKPVEQLAEKSKLWKKEWKPRYDRLIEERIAKGKRERAMMG